MPVKPLPSNPNLHHLRYQSKDLLEEHAAGSASAAQRIREFHPRFKTAADHEILEAPFSLSDAQLTVARERGFASWTRLKRHIEQPTVADRLTLPHHQRIEDQTFRLAVDLLDAGDAAGLCSLLNRHPNLVHQRVIFEGGNYFRHPTLLEFIAENPVRHGVLPANIVEMTQIILDAGPDSTARNEALGLVATGRVPRECQVQLSLINLLCNHGADPHRAAYAAALHGEQEALNALMGRGVQVDLPLAAALDRTDEFRQLLAVSNKQERHLALALASQYGHLEIVRWLLDAGEDPSRYNPPGGHSHATPLHQAALAGHGRLVRLLVERGARLDLKDVLWQGTPADWARYEGRTGIEAFLRSQEKK